MATGFKGFDTIDELQAAISRPAVEAQRMFTTQEIAELLQTVVREYDKLEKHAPIYLLKLVCEALEVDLDEVLHARTNAD